MYVHIFLTNNFECFLIPAAPQLISFIRPVALRMNQIDNHWLGGFSWNVILENFKNVEACQFQFG
jgi:hypothetical protein